MSLEVTVGGSFSGPVALSLAGLPAGVSVAWSANPVTPVSGIAQSILTLTVAPTAQTGVFPVAITAFGDGLSASQQLQMQVLPVLIRFRPSPVRWPRPPVWRF